MRCYGFFLSINKASATPTMMIATIIPTIEGTKYWSATDGAAVGVGASVGCASIMFNAVSEVDGQ
jgi:hypothetical protein